MLSQSALLTAYQAHGISQKTTSIVLQVSEHNDSLLLLG